MSDQPPDAKVVTPDPDVKPVEEEVKPDADSPEASLKYYFVPNRHDRRKAAAIKRKEERKKRKNEQHR